MLEELFGSKSSERILTFLAAREDGYAAEIARFFDLNLYATQLKLEKLEEGAILVSTYKGRTRLFQFNPRYPFLKELKSLLEKSITFYPRRAREDLLMNRRRPRRKGKEIISQSK